jgi:hypothetical protein
MGEAKEDKTYGLEPLPTNCSLNDIITFFYDRCDCLDTEDKLKEFLNQAVYSAKELKMKHPPQYATHANIGLVKGTSEDLVNTDVGYSITISTLKQFRATPTLDATRHSRFLIVRDEKIVGIVYSKRYNS